MVNMLDMTIEELEAMLKPSPYSPENVARLKAKAWDELTTRERIILHNVEVSQVVGKLKAERGMA